MKTKFTFLSILSVIVVFGAVAQGVEYDDVYFRSKDRVVLAASKPIPVRQSSKDMEVVSTLNPTDSYSARNVNPEYLSQSTLNPSATSEAAAYFVPNYMPASVNQNIKKSSDYSNYSSTPYGGSSVYNPYYGNSCMSCYGGMGSYGSLYSPYGYSGLSMSMSMGYGSMGMGSMYGMSPWSMGYGMGMGMNYGMGMGMNYGMGYSSYGYGYQPQVIVTGGDTNGTGTVYGKRSSRSSELNNAVTTGNRQSTYVDTQGRTRGSSGRVSGNESNANVGSYYQRGWRANPETNTRLSSGTTSNPWQQNRNNNGNNSWMNNSGNSRSSNWSDTNRGGSNMGAIGGRSSGSSSGGGSSSGVRHGRN